jgi:uncharacterized protein YijF (DUF1287 family)
MLNKSPSRIFLLDIIIMACSVKRIFLIFLTVIILFPALLVIFGQHHLYHGPTIEPSKLNTYVDSKTIVKEGRKLIGLWYDPLQGYLNNIGGKLGFIVCMDVPVIAYRNSGISILKLLEADFKQHPEHYGPTDGKPGNPYFGRRARNLYSYCKYNGCLIMDGLPEVGDVVFMSRSPKGKISHIALVSDVDTKGYKVIEASRDEWYVTREENSDLMFKRGYIFRGFGRPLMSTLK